MRKIKIYTDGSTRKNPGPGGWAAVVILESGNYKVLTGASDDAQSTNNRMELMGPISALEALPYPCEVEIVSDSQYVVNGMTKWVLGWQRKNFVNVKNPDLWKRLIAASQRHKVKWNWVRGHNGDHFNEIADKAAFAAAKERWG